MLVPGRTLAKVLIELKYIYYYQWLCYTVQVPGGAVTRSPCRGLFRPFGVATLARIIDCLGDGLGHGGFEIRR